MQGVRRNDGNGDERIDGGGVFARGFGICLNARRELRSYETRSAGSGPNHGNFCKGKKYNKHFDWTDLALNIFTFISVQSIWSI